ncbi:MAG: DUF2971 domain-containing protein [Bacteroidaceae bacterium]|nr:DUF2971 domain-containing protein [Bacteroidaceae bacterium]
MKSSKLLSFERKESLAKKIQETLGADYEVDVNVEVSSMAGLVKELFDIVIFHKKLVIAVLDYRYGFASFNIPQNAEIYQNRFKKVGVKCGIIYFGRGDKFYIWNKGVLGFQTLDFSNLVVAIKEKRNFGLRPLIDEIAFEILSCKPTLYDEQLTIETHKELDELFSESSIEYDDDNGVFFLKTEYEDSFFKLLLSCSTPKSICRYTSLESLFLTIRDNKQPMCSITCMNDKGEVSYTDKYIGLYAFAESQSSIVENNNCFILSCCNLRKSDDLTMWRLYGNDAKGACIEYEINEELIDEEKFFLSPVSYGQDDGTHYELEFIRQILNKRLNGWKLEFKRWFIWKHFFKSYLFKDEEEFRLLFITNNDVCDRIKPEIKWIMDSTNNIVSRICLFSLNDGSFPLKLRKAIIGPKCPELDCNVVQLNFMNSHTKTIMPIRWKYSISASKIQDYR